MDSLTPRILEKRSIGFVVMLIVKAAENSQQDIRIQPFSIVIHQSNGYGCQSPHLRLPNPMVFRLMLRYLRNRGP
jgi:hypothetical protein